MKLSKTNGTALKTLLAASMIGLSSLSANAFAEMNFNGDLTGNVSATSTYLWRGVAQSIGAAVQGGVNYTDQSGIHGGLWTSNVAFGNELDIILGYGGKAGSLSYDVGAIFYQYTTFPAPGIPDPDFEEIYANISQGQFSAQISNSSDYGTYFEIAGTFPVKSWEMTAHFGHYSLKDTAGVDYADYNVNFKKDLKDFSVSFMFSDTDMDYDDFRSIVTVSKDFGV